MSNIDEETVAFGVGPLELDVEMARAHGWTQKQIEHAAFAIGAISREVSYEVAIANGYSYKCLQCECWTIQPSEGSCHLCVADDANAAGG